MLSFARKGLIFSAKYPLKDFPRISDLIKNTDDFCTVALEFSLERNIPCVRGTLKFDVLLTCQRCLNDLKISQNPNFNVAFLTNEHQKYEIDSSFETLLNTNQEFSTIDFLTDEILISLPMIPMHTHQCVAYQNHSPQKHNPFAQLKHIQKTRSNPNGSSKK